jgi:hypothetical protein
MRCRRWNRVSAKLIAALEDCGLMEVAELDELAERFLADDSTIPYPLAWVSPQWLAVDLDDGTSRAVTVSEDALGQCSASFAPPYDGGRPVARSERARPDSTTSFGARMRSVRATAVRSSMGCSTRPTHSIIQQAQPRTAPAPAIVDVTASQPTEELR